MQIFGQSRAKAASASRWNPGFCAIRTLTCAALGFRSLLPPYHHEPLCSRSPLTSKFLVRILGESHPVSFRAEKQGNCPQSGGFGQSESALAEYGKSSTWGRGCNGGFGQASHCPLCRAFADPGVVLDLRPRTAPMPEEHNPERVHQCMLCRTLA